jgi:hypothetical protein
MVFQIGWMVLGDPSELEHNPGPKNAVWHMVNVVVVKEIPGKGQKYKTIRTSDKTLWECDLTVRSITDGRYRALKILCEQGGPFKVVSNHTPAGLNMYIVDCSITHDEKDKEPPLTETETGDILNVATWQIKLLEAND